ncbi:LmbE family N-acetylglucosaminyl deacetylase [Williamsia limnetica]|uniref:LmbE family N-acetylglucosaminyl deacetylase n=1 Tax=Williamsia limnetica TaxID=882452 RepID=A0A318RKF7_WILLI|nr:PIG-L deacetylase family protein [Williamsia limnetica]PYE14569.1 LmbE family N-acetylglucosaminyl deacetylase [Williamsia limnetica]
MLIPFPTDWQTALVLVPHPDDPEYGVAAAVAKWTTAGKSVAYALASRGEAGIEGMAPAEAGPAREIEQRESARIVGVASIEFWGFPDSAIMNTVELRAAVTEVIERVRPQVIVSMYGGPGWGPDMPNQSDHIEFAAAVLQAYDALDDKPRWLFENSPEATHVEEVGDHVETAVQSLAAHRKYLSVLDPDTPVNDQARAQVEMATAAREDYDNQRVVGFELKRRSR